VSTSPSYGSRLSQFLARSRTPVHEKETRMMTTISAPIMSTSSSGTGVPGTPIQEDSPGFGLVCDTLVLQREIARLTINLESWQAFW